MNQDTQYNTYDGKAYVDAYKLFLKLKSLGLPLLTIDQEVELVKEIAYLRQEEINELRSKLTEWETDEEYHM
jgi:hypothetical protein